MLLIVMEDNCKKVLLTDLIEKRRILSELRHKVIKTREINENGVSGNQSHVEGEQENSNIAILNTSQHAKESQNKTKGKGINNDNMMEDTLFNLTLANTFKRTPDKTVNDESRANFDYNSDDSVKDKNYEPNKDDYYSSCSEISNSPIEACVYQVKRRIFSPEKKIFHKKNCQLPGKRHITSVNLGIDSELLTLEDLIDPPNPPDPDLEKLDICDSDIFILPPTKKPCLERVNVNVYQNGYFSGDSDNEESLVLPLQSKCSKNLATYTYKPNNNGVMSDATLSTRMVVTSKRAVSLDYDLNKPKYGVMAVDYDGTIYLTNLINTEAEGTIILFKIFLGEITYSNK